MLGARPQPRERRPAFWGVRWGTSACLSLCLALLCQVPSPLRSALSEDTDCVLSQGSSLDISAHGRQHILGDRGLSLEVDAEDFKVSPSQAIR